MKLRLIIVLAIIATAISANAGWDKDTKQTFKRQRAYNVEFDLSQLKFGMNGDLSREDFVNGIVERDGIPVSKIEKMLDMFPSLIIRNFNCIPGKKVRELVYPAEELASTCNVKIRILKINEKAGIDAEVLLYVDDPEKGETIKIWRKDEIKATNFLREMQEKALDFADDMWDEFESLNLVDDID